MPETADLPIYLVAEKVGYREPAALRRIFKCATGISPLQYRQRFHTIATA
jgi:transcriptional regulator GlxA family with amidase domain